MATVLPQEPERVTRVWVTLGPAARGCPGIRTWRCSARGWPSSLASARMKRGGRDLEPCVVLGQDVVWMMTLQDSFQAWPRAAGLSIAQSSETNGHLKSRWELRRRMDGRCSKELLAWLCSVLPSCPSTSSSQCWESPSTAPFPRRGWSRHLFFLQKDPSIALDLKAPTTAVPAEPLGAAPALRTRTVCVHLAGVVLLSADF